MTASTPARVLVLRRRAFGDFLLSLPALGALRAALPEAEIDLAVDPPLVAAARAWAPVSRVLAYPDRSVGRGGTRLAALVAFVRRARARQYDWAIDLHSTPQTAAVTRGSGARVRVGLDRRGRRWAYTHRVERSIERQDGRRTRYMAEAFLDFVRRVGVETTGVALTGYLPVEPPEREGAGSPRLALAPAATWGAKAWPVGHYAEVARRAADELGAAVTVYAAPGEEAVAQAVLDQAPGARRPPSGDLLAWASQLAGEDLLLSGDSGARHLALALGVATIGLFGPTDPWGSTPAGGGAPWRRHPIACSPCQRLECPLRENYCLTRVPAEAVWPLVVEALRRRTSGGAS